MRTADESSRSSMLEVAASDSLKSDKGHEMQNVFFCILQTSAMCLSQHLQQSNPGRICLLLPDLFATTGKPHRFSDSCNRSIIFVELPASTQHEGRQTWHMWTQQDKLIAL